jgi:hypothetical protein
MADNIAMTDRLAIFNLLYNACSMVDQLVRHLSDYEKLQEIRSGVTILDTVCFCIEIGLYKALHLITVDLIKSVQN